MKRSLRFCLLPLVTAALAACGGSSDPEPPAPVACSETGAYACKTGETEPLYVFQWALNYAKSYFNQFPDTFGGGLDLNVEPVHREGIKGQGVNVLVVDSGVDLHNEDLAPNADFSMSHNAVNQTSDPYPTAKNPRNDAHGTHVAGIIGAAQNGKGVMGIAPLAKLGGVNFLEGQSLSSFAAALGGAPWSAKAHVFNASYGISDFAAPYDFEDDAQTLVLRAMKKLRGGKGGIYIKAAGNDFDTQACGLPFAYYDCTNPNNDAATQEPSTITVAAVNARGEASTYSSAGSVVWVAGMGGEYGSAGQYGEGKDTEYSGPTIFTTDLRGCTEGYSNKGARTPFLRGETQRSGVPDNPDCDYSYMNGTSSATPTLSGVVALMLSANPDLTWRDVRDILRASARKVDATYRTDSPGAKVPYGAQTDLRTNALLPTVGSAADVAVGSTAVPIDLGWQKNGAGHEYSNWYGFGVPDSAKAVALARQYKQNPQLSLQGDVHIPPFQEVAYWQLNDKDVPYGDIGQAQVRTGPFPYRQVSLIGTLQGTASRVDTFQVRLTGDGVCLGSLGVAVRSPAGTVSILKLPNDHFRAGGVAQFERYGLSSMAFYGESAQGQWQIFALAANPDVPLEGARACVHSDTQRNAAGYQFFAESRIITQ